MKKEILSVHVCTWLSWEELPEGMTIRQIIGQICLHANTLWPHSRISCSMARRWKGHDPLPDVDANFGIVEVYRFLTLVDVVRDPDNEIGIDTLPPAVRSNRTLGQPWYEILIYVLIPGANLETRPLDLQTPDTLPQQNRLQKGKNST